MSEHQLIQLIQASTGQLVLLIGQIIAINFAMIVGIYYFLNQAGWAIKTAAFLLYTLGSLMFLLFAIRESGLLVSAMTMLKARDPEQLSGVARYLVAFSDHPMSDGLTILINTSFWALWLAVGYLLFFWRKVAR